MRVNKKKVGNWDYASSKLTRIAHELVKGPRITFCELDDSLSYRADKVSFSGVALIKDLKEKFPYALISGGGHDAAGNIRFNGASKENIINYILNYLKKIDKV